MAPDPWDVGNGNDPYGPGPNPVYVPMPWLLPSSAPRADIFGLAGQVNDLNADGGVNAARSYRRVGLAHITLFKDGYEGIIHASDDVAPGQRIKWANASSSVTAAAEGIREWRTTNQGVQGATARAIMDKAQVLLDSLLSTAPAAARMGYIVDMFSRDISSTKDWFKTTKTGFAEFPTPGMAGYDELNFATQITIRDSYNPPIDMIGYNHPDLPAAPETPGLPGATASPPQLGSGQPAPSGLDLTGLGLPEALPVGTTVPAAAQQDPAGTQDGLGQAAQQAASGAGDAAQKAAEGAQEAAKQAASAGQQALESALNGQEDPLGVPEGVLGLGPAGLGGLGTAGAMGGARAGGGGGSGVGTGPTARAAVTLPPVSKAIAATPVSSAGLSSGGGVPGAGAPAAGQRGGPGGDSVHKTSKALYRKHEELVDTSDAVVAVVGGEDTHRRPPGPPS